MLASHIDGCVLDEVRTKLSIMFTPSVRRHMTGELLSKKELEEFRRESTGVMGGTAL